MCHDIELFEKNTILDDLICPINKGILNDPHFIKECGHIFCFDCINPWIIKYKKCPICNEIVGDPIKNTLQKSYLVNNIIMKLIIKCHNEKCKWFDNWSKLMDHLKMCPFENINCSMKQCNEQFERQNYEKHSLTCQFRVLPCNLCNDNIQHDLYQNHQENECKMSLIKCNQCQNNIYRKDIYSHYEICQLMVISCKYYYLGCDFKTQRINMENHVDENAQYHLNLFDKKYPNDITQTIKIPILTNKKKIVEILNYKFLVFIAQAADSNYYIFWKLESNHNDFIKIEFDYDLFNFKCNDYAWNHKISINLFFTTSFCGEFPEQIKSIEDFNKSDFVFDKEIYMRINHFRPIVFQR